ncbi:V-type ATPase subunit [Streptomyces sp. 11x1]|uniref:V-type ATPase subunit n=1 Tax=Streptomyces sp. 11x1 TaxID=3038642 RepID=UPI00292CAC24|nr:V-type ATPase subunit [Streptomyces sp. 11x1]WNZ06588.1 V-type ATPase subunit [Streptomyces sp. 11x1]
MGAGWVAGTTRARALRTRCLGREGIGELASSGTLDEALRHLAATAYRRDVTVGATAAEAQRAISSTLLWHLRVLAGWQPSAGARAVRALAAGFEISNVMHHLGGMFPDSHGPGPGAEPFHPAPHRLGALATAWPRLSRTRTAAELRTALASSSWGDPGGDSPAAIASGMRISAAVRLADAVPDAARWAAARVALQFGRETLVLGRRLPDVSLRRAARLLGPRAVASGAYADFRQALPPTASWLFDDVDEAADLWRAEGRWWHAVGQDGRELLRRSGFGPRPVVGAVALLSADAWRTRGALELAARGGGPKHWTVEVPDGPG